MFVRIIIFFARRSPYRRFALILAPKPSKLTLSLSPSRARARLRRDPRNAERHRARESLLSSSSTAAGRFTRTPFYSVSRPFDRLRAPYMHIVSPRPQPSSHLSPDHPEVCRRHAATAAVAAATAAAARQRRIVPSTAPVARSSLHRPTVNNGGRRFVAASIPGKLF